MFRRPPPPSSQKSPLRQHEHILSRSQPHERSTSVFIDERPRAYTRDVWYASEHDDFDADALDEPLERVRAGPTASFDSVWGYDAYDESSYRPMVAERADTLAQVRADVSSAAVVGALERRRIRAAAAPPLAELLPPPAPLRVRDEILSSLAERRTRETLFSTDFAAAVPAHHRREFLASLEIDSLLAVLGTHLYTVVAGGHVHSCESAIIRELSAVGARFQSAETLTLDAPPVLLPADARALQRAHVHAHRQRLRILYFGTAVDGVDDETATPPGGAQRRPCARLTLTRLQVCINLRASHSWLTLNVRGGGTTPPGYRVRVVYQAVDDAANVLCFCTFQFSR